MGANEERSDPEKCIAKAHYWVIDAKNLGVCKKCGAKKQFSFDVNSWPRPRLVISNRERSSC